MNCRSRLSPAAQMGDFVGGRGGECGRFRAMISAIVFGGDCFRVRVRERAGTVADFGCGGGRYRLRSTSHGAIFSDLSGTRWALSGARCAEGEIKKGSSDAEGAIG